MENIQQPSTSGNHKAHVPNIPCRGLCKRKRHYNQVIEIAYTFLAAVRNTRRNGLLLTFLNTTPHDVDLIWRDYDGDEIPIIKFGPGDSYKFSAVTAHNWCCRNTRTGRNYLLNAQETLSGNELFGENKSHTIQITAPKIPLSLRQAALYASASCLKDRHCAFVLSVPYSVQSDLYLAKVSSKRREYYSISGEPGLYGKSYSDKDEGPWIYPPGMDWSAFQE